MNVKINNVFWTLQGEGMNWGRRALFVRMPFCNLACSWCDTSFNTYEEWTEDKFKNFALQEPGRFAVLTGGEPSMNKHSPIVIKWLKDLGFKIAIESNGTFPIPEGIDFITISPKRDADYDINEKAFTQAHEFKYVIDEGFDFKVLDKHKPFNQSYAKLTLSPEFNNMNKSLNLIINYIKENPEWTLSLQTHKWINIP